MQYLLWTTLITSLSVFALGLLSIVKDSHSNTNRNFFGFSFFVSLWMVFNYLSNSPDISKQIALIINHLVLFFSGLSLIFLVRFSAYLTNQTKKINTVSFVALAPVIVSLTPLVIVDIEYVNNVYSLEFGILSNAYFLIVFYLFIKTIYLLTKGFKTSSGLNRARMQVVLLSFFASIILVLITNVIVPLLFNSFELTNFGPLFMLVLSGGMTYAIVRHKLFDIRLIIARSIAYFMSLGSLLLLYGVLTFGLIQYFFKGESIDSELQLIYGVLVVLLALTFQPLKKFFDKVTNRIFYRDSYNSEVLLQELNTVFVASLGVHELLQSASNLLAEKLKADFCTIGVKKDGSMPQKIIGTKLIDFEEADIKKTRSITPWLDEKVVVRDFLESDSELKSYMQKYDIAVLARIAGESSRDGKEGLGYLLLGDKKSGNIYNSQDIKVIEIIANELVIAIQNALRFEEIKTFSQTLQKKVDDATSELKTKNEKLQDLDKAKDDFISMASHQLRTPLTTIKGYLSMLSDGDFGKLSKKQGEIIGLAYTSSERMVYLIADLLNASRINTGKFVIDSDEVDLVEVIKGEVEQLQRSAQARNLKLETKLPKKFPLVMLDENKTRQVMMNFIDNAIFYTPEGGTITVSLQSTKDSLEFKVEDNGIGVPKKEQEHLFTKFYRAQNARQARPDGTGLGLYLAKKVVTAQGGSIIFSSEEGEGSTFGFRFSLAAVAAKNLPKKSK